MNNQAFSKTWIIIILIVFIAGGILAWQWRTKQEAFPIEFPKTEEPKEETMQIIEFPKTEEPKEETMQIKVYFQKFITGPEECDCGEPVIRDIPKTGAAAKAALEELIKGPTEEERVQGYSGCLPGEGTVATYRNWYETQIVTAGKEDWFANKFLSPNGEFAPWGDKVIVKDVNIKDGTAYADFSKELYSYGGGSCFVGTIIGGIYNTLLQFPQIKELKIFVEGKEAMLEP